MLAVTGLAGALSPQIKKYQPTNATIPPFGTTLKVAVVEHVEVAGKFVYNVAEVSGNVVGMAVEVAESLAAADFAGPVDQDEV